MNRERRRRRRGPRAPDPRGGGARNGTVARRGRTIGGTRRIGTVARRRRRRGGGDVCGNKLPEPLFHLSQARKILLIPTLYLTSSVV